MRALFQIILFCVNMNKFITVVSGNKGRLLSNIFGILGNEKCVGDLGDRNSTGFCYNEVECLLKGGLFGGYCGPPSFKGVCCVFVSGNCGKRFTEKISYFTNKSFPKSDIEPYQCLLSIKPLQNTCWIRFDLETFETIGTPGGTCGYDSLTLLNKPDGPSGTICGNRSGYSTISRSPKNKDLNLALRVQGPSYRWNIKISQIGCDEIIPFISMDNCGNANPSGITTRKRKSQNYHSHTMQTVTRRRKKTLMKSRQQCHNGKCRVIRRRIQGKLHPTSNNKNHLKNKMFIQKYVPSNRQYKCRENFGRNENILTKIIDGTETSINEYPWTVSLQIADGHICGGSLISENWVLTAAHCIDFSAGNIVERLMVILGDHDLTTNEDTTNRILRHTKKIIYHPGWSSPDLSNDYALIELKQPVPFSQAIAPVCLPLNDQENFANDIGTIVGWGITELGQLSSVLREAEVFILSNITCYETLKPYGILPDANIICIQGSPQGVNQTTCNGDSGGPLMVQKNGKFIHVGLTSYGLSAECSTDLPTMFARTTSILEWISAVISSTSIL